MDRALEKTAAECFGPRIPEYIAIVEAVLRRTSNYTYRFMKISAYEELVRNRAPTEEINKIYWSEILRRAHHASISSLRRNLGWIRSTALCRQNNEFLGFAACLRSLIESVGDSCHVIAGMPRNIAKHNRDIAISVEGKQRNSIVISKEMEDALIHYSHARKLKGVSKSEPTVAKLSVEYIDVLEKHARVPNIKLLYSTLCEVVHPASSSVGFEFSIIPTDDQHESFRVNEAGHQQTIEAFIADYSKTLSFLPFLGFDPGLLTVRVLHRFDIFPTIPELRGFSFRLSDAARQVEELLK